MIVDDYFAAMERGLRQNVPVGTIEEPITCLASDDYNGLIRFRFFFWDGSYLDVYEVVSTELGYPVRLHYAYTYLREGQRVFRYDNAPTILRLRPILTTNTSGRGSVSPRLTSRASARCWQRRKLGWPTSSPESGGWTWPAAPGWRMRA